MLLTEPFLCRPATLRAELAIHEADAPTRPAVEAFIRAIYAAAYGAAINTWAPMLVTLETGGEIRAAAGYRGADAPLYLERYLRQPIQRAIAQVAGTPVARGEIVEVGHFASARAGEGRRLMLALGRHLSACGYRWVVITATRELRSLFARLGIASIALGAADPRALGAGAASWGSYYEHAPVVLAGELLPNLARIGG